jgi:hypothetical protein
MTVKITSTISFVSEQKCNNRFISCLHQNIKFELPIDTIKNKHLQADSGWVVTSSRNHEIKKPIICFQTVESTWK